MSWLLVAAWTLPLLLAAPALGSRGRWLPALAPLPALAAALLLPAGAVVEIPWLLLGTRLGLDEVSRTFLTFTAILWLAAGLYTATAMRATSRAGSFRAFFLLAMSGNLWLIVAADLVSFYIGFAMMGLSSYALVIHDRDPAALRAGRVYLTMTIFGEVALFVALVLIAAHAGTLTPTAAELAGLGDLAIGMLFLGLGIKAGLVPLHVWLPLAHPAAPVPASAVLSGAMIKVALLGWLRFIPIGSEPMIEWGMLFAAAGLLTLFYAIAVGLLQSNPKVILAYSSVSKMGLVALILGLMMIEPATAAAGVAGLTLFAAHHALVKGALFLGVGLRLHGGFQPFVLGGMILLALSLADVPPTSGAVAKYGIKPAFAALDWSWLDVAITIGTAATAALMARFLWVIWRTASAPESGYGAATAAWAGLLVLVGAFPWVLGSPSAWISNLAPVFIGVIVTVPVALAAWVSPARLGKLIGQIPPGDLVVMVRPLVIALRLVLRASALGWRTLLLPVGQRLADLGRGLGREPMDPERTARAWPNLGMAWSLILALLLLSAFAAAGD